MEHGGEVLGVVPYVQLEQAQVAEKLGVVLGVVFVAGVEDDDVGETRLASGALDRGADLLVDAAAPADLRMVAK